MGLISGRLGESLLSEPLLRYFKQNPLPDLLKKTEGLNDDRLIAIVTALIVEDRIDEMHRAFLPRYKRLIDATDFTFSVKIKLAEALALVPPHVLRAADIIRRIRNEFAHNLDRDKFTQLPDQLQKDLCQLRSAVYAQFGQDDAKPKASLGEEFRALAFFCIVGLEGYSDNLM